MKVQIVLFAAIVALSNAYSISDELLEPTTSKLPLELLALNDDNKTETKSFESFFEKSKSKLSPFSVSESVDWRSKGAVTHVRYQGSCNAGWAFAVAGAVEGLLHLSRKKVVPLSAQNLIDCTVKHGNWGCHSGNIRYAFDYIKANHGIQKESSYKYTANQGNCKYNPAEIGAKIAGYEHVAYGNEEKLKEAVNARPVAAMIDAIGHTSFKHYTGGIWFEPQCSSHKVNHGVLIVGYGTDPHSKVDYWLVKNSFGQSWGEKGYIKIIRNRQNHCGIASAAIYPY